MWDSSICCIHCGAEETSTDLVQGAETHCETLLEKQNGSSPLAQMSQHAVDISGEMSLKLSNLSSTASEKEDGKKVNCFLMSCSYRGFLLFLLTFDSSAFS